MPKWVVLSVSKLFRRRLSVVGVVSRDSLPQLLDPFGLPRLPIGELLLTFNANRTVPDFLESGVWSPRRPRPTRETHGSLPGGHMVRRRVQGLDLGLSNHPKSQRLNFDPYPHPHGA